MTLRELLEKLRKNNDRINEMADTLEKEQRARTEAETVEYEALIRENDVLAMRMRVLANEENKRDGVEDPKRRAEKLLRENARNGVRSEIYFTRDLMTVTDAQNGAIIPLNIQDILKPLNEGFILDKVGLSLPTGLVGDFVWTTYEMVEASILGEGVELTDKKIPFNKLTASPERIGVAIPVTNQALNQTDGLLEQIIREVMPQAVQQLLNKIMFSVDKVTGATNLVGPFVALKGSAKTLSAVPTGKELYQMKAAVLATGIQGDNLCWVMSKSTAAILEATPINEKGIFVPIMQDGKIAGLPVYTTNLMRNGTTEFIGLGDWRYQAMGMFGTLRFTVDPYSKARKDSVDFVLNTDFATKTLRPEAFLLAKLAAGTSV